MDFSVLIIIVIIVIVVGYILSRPFVRSDAAPGTPHERNKPSDPSDDALTIIEGPESINSKDEHSGGEIAAK
jgi:hypothetical protein